jgi:ferredoxin
VKISVDMTRCTGHGFCEALAEDVFEVRSDGVTHLLDDDPAESHREAVQEAVDTCPTRALSLLEG